MGSGNSLPFSCLFSLIHSSKSFFRDMSATLGRMSHSQPGAPHVTWFRCHTLAPYCFTYRSRPSMYSSYHMKAGATRERGGKQAGTRREAMLRCHFPVRSHSFTTRLPSFIESHIRDSWPLVTGQVRLGTANVTMAHCHIFWSRREW